MKLTRNLAILLAILVLTGVHTARLSAKGGNDDQLLKTREAVWRAWFAGDTKTLQDLVPPGTIVMSGSDAKWQNQPDVLQGSADFHSSGGKLVRLEFPRTEIQHFGDVAIVWSNYSLETADAAGKRSKSSGRATEIFVWQHGRWTNPGWHTDDKN